MRRVIIADMADSLRSWAAVILAFITTATALLLSSVLVSTGFAHRDSAWGDTNYVSEVFIFSGGLNLVMGVVVGTSVLSGVSALVVESRCSAFARLRLSGASPHQILASVLSQVFVVSLLSTGIGTAIALLLADPFIAWSAAARGTDPTPALPHFGVMGAVGALCVCVALLAALPPALRVCRRSAVDAFHRSTGVGTAPRPSVLRWLALMAIAALIITLFMTMTLTLQAAGDQMKADYVLMVALVVLVLTGAFLGVGAPIFLAPLTRMWTRVFPRRAFLLHLARENVVALAHRLVRLAIPTMFSVGLVAGLLTLVASVNASMEASGRELRLENSSALILLSLLWVPLVIALTGAFGSVVMTSTRRDADLALCAIIGATPLQRVVLACAEAVIVTVSACLMGLVMSVLSAVALLSGLAKICETTRLDIPWGEFAVVTLLALGVTCLAMVVPTIPALRRSAPRVIAHLVSE